MPVLRDTWELKERLGKGSFGEVYRAVDVRDGTEVAIKMEERDDKAPRQLEYEYRVYKTLKGLPCIPAIHWFGVSDDYSFLVMEKLGPSLATRRARAETCPSTRRPPILGFVPCGTFATRASCTETSNQRTCACIRQDGCT